MHFYYIYALKNKKFFDIHRVFIYIHYIFNTSYILISNRVAVIYYLIMLSQYLKFYHKFTSNFQKQTLLKSRFLYAIFLGPSSTIYGTCFSKENFFFIKPKLNSPSNYTMIVFHWIYSYKKKPSSVLHMYYKLSTI